MSTDLDLSTDALRGDLSRAQAALGVSVETTEDKEASAGGRVMTTRTHHLPYGARTTTMRARFVKQGWAELAKKMFVKEIEIGDEAFDDAVYIATDTPELTRAFVGIARVREAIVSLVAKDCMIDVVDDELAVTRPDAIGSADEEIAEALALYAHLS
ncbi:MAG: hypothetical protein J0L92_22090 [Deltaproteobacteria bacterium]|nr:hypothetical protein [Deltaproteobacteria bacterium]